MIYGAGMLEAGMTFSFGQLVIDDEISAMVKRIVGGISVEGELMGVDLIKKVGIGNNFLAERHTLNHLKAEQIQATIIDRRMREEWVKDPDRQPEGGPIAEKPRAETVVRGCGQRAQKNR